MSELIILSLWIWRVHKIHLTCRGKHTAKPNGKQEWRIQFYNTIDIFYGIQQPHEPDFMKRIIEFILLDILLYNTQSVMSLIGEHGQSFSWNRQNCTLCYRKSILFCYTFNKSYILSTTMAKCQNYELDGSGFLNSNLHVLTIFDLWQNQLEKDRKTLGVCSLPVGSYWSSAIHNTNHNLRSLMRARNTE